MTRVMMRCVGVTPDTAPGGIPIKLYLGLTKGGKVVTNRVPVIMGWGRRTGIRLGFRGPVLFDGVAFFQGYRNKAPIRIQNFDQIQLQPAVTLELIYTLGEFDFSKGKLDINQISEKSQRRCPGC